MWTCKTSLPLALLTRSSFRRSSRPADTLVVQTFIEHVAETVIQLRLVHRLLRRRLLFAGCRPADAPWDVCLRPLLCRVSACRRTLGCVSAAAPAPGVSLQTHPGMCVCGRSCAGCRPADAPWDVCLRPLLRLLSSRYPGTGRIPGIENGAIENCNVMSVKRPAEQRCRPDNGERRSRDRRSSESCLPLL